VAAGAVRDPAFSPLGRRLAYVRGGAVWIMQADGTGQRRLTFQGVPERSPRGRRGATRSPSRPDAPAAA
jgi:Tol biopolymer transport system component